MSSETPRWEIGNKGIAEDYELSGIRLYVVKYILAFVRSRRVSYESDLDTIRCLLVPAVRDSVSDLQKDIAAFVDITATVLDFSSR